MNYKIILNEQKKTIEERISIYIIVKKQIYKVKIASMEVKWIHSYIVYITH